MPPATLAAARLLVASMVLLAWLRFGENRPLPADLRSWAGYAQIALFGHALPRYSIGSASMAVPVAEMSILVATTPLFAVLFAFVARREWPLRMIVFGLLARSFRADG
ncbi:EamA family transporter [Mesorhizobium atlanticum]